MTLHIAIIGSGPSGMTAAMLLARQGHRISLIDRDPGPVPGRPWERIGVMQFHLPHSLRAPRPAPARRAPAGRVRRPAGRGRGGAGDGSGDAGGHGGAARTTLGARADHLGVHHPRTRRSPPHRSRRRGRRRGQPGARRGRRRDLRACGPRGRRERPGRATRLRAPADGRGWADRHRLRHSSVPAAPGSDRRRNQRGAWSDQGARGVHAAGVRPRPGHLQHPAGARLRRHRAGGAAP